jgi:hypothetical protein
VDEMLHRTFIDCPPTACSRCVGTGLRVIPCLRGVARLIGPRAFTRCKACNGDGYLTLPWR